MIKRILCLLLVLCMCFANVVMASAKSTYVHSYHRKDGTYVSGYYRHTSGGGSSSDLDTYVYSSSVDTSKLKTVNLYRGNSIVGSANKDSLVYVQGYYTKDGTYVRPHYRTYANNYLNDNFSYLGVSTLTPLQKYKSFKYSTDNNVKSAEKYLLYNSIYLDKTLTEQNQSSLKVYASELIKKQTNNLIPTSGETFYKSIGLDDYTAEQLSKYDETGVMTSDEYLYFIVNDYLQASGKSYADISENIQWIIPYYSALLDMYSSKLIDSATVTKFGTWFYSMFLTSSEANDQIQMDLLQSFTHVSNTQQYDQLQSLLSINFTSLKDDDNAFDEYLEDNYSSDLSSEAISYSIDMELMVDYPSTFLDNVISRGETFYTGIGFTEEDAVNQVYQDILMVEINK